MPLLAQRLHGAGRCRRRDFIVPALRELGFGIPVEPDGAFYVYLDCSAFSDDSSRFAIEMLEQAGVAMVPGEDFGLHRPERWPGCRASKSTLPAPTFIHQATR